MFLAVRPYGLYIVSNVSRGQNASFFRNRQSKKMKALRSYEFSVTVHHSIQRNIQIKKLKLSADSLSTPQISQSQIHLSKLSQRTEYFRRQNVMGD